MTYLILFLFNIVLHPKSNKLAETSKIQMFMPIQEYSTHLRHDSCCYLVRKWVTWPRVATTTSKRISTSSSALKVLDDLRSKCNVNYNVLGRMLTLIGIGVEFIKENLNKELWHIVVRIITSQSTCKTKVEKLQTLDPKLQFTKSIHNIVLVFFFRKEHLFNVISKFTYT